MPDPVNPPPSAPAANTTTTGLPSNVAAALACIPLIGGLVFYILEKHDQLVRFYAMQSIIFGGVWFLFNLASWILHSILWMIPVAGPLFAGLWIFLSSLIHLGLFVLMIITMVKAFSGVRWDIPYIGPIARKQIGEAV